MVGAPLKFESSCSGMLAAIPQADPLRSAAAAISAKLFRVSFERKESREAKEKRDRGKEKRR